MNNPDTDRAFTHLMITIVLIIISLMAGGYFLWGN